MPFQCRSNLVENANRPFPLIAHVSIHDDPIDSNCVGDVGLSDSKSSHPDFYCLCHVFIACHITSIPRIFGTLFDVYRIFGEHAFNVLPNIRYGKFDTPNGVKMELPENSNTVIAMDSSTTRTDLVICKYISQAMEANGITQADLSKALEGRSKGYVSDRVLGKRSWAISELDRLAPLFGLPDALSLVAAACGSISSEAARAYEARERQKITDDLVDRIAAHPEDYVTAANDDPNKMLEAETPRD